MSDNIRMILITIAVLAGAISILYFYFSADIFVNLLKRPLRFISVGMLLIDIGVLFVTFFSYGALKGEDFALLGVPLSTYFYIFYVVGSVLVILGAKQFKRSPKPAQ